MATIVKKWCVTDPVAETIVFDWTIENFLSQHGTGVCLKSKIFSSKSAQWYLSVSSHDKYSSKGNYVSLRVSRTMFNSVVSILASFKVSIGGTIRYESSASKYCNSLNFFGALQLESATDSEMVGFGIDKLIPIEDAKQYLVNDSLTIRCELKILPEDNKDSYHRDSESLPVSKHTLKDDMASLMQDGASSDVTLVAGRSNFRAHKAILSARSPVFARMFQHRMIENTMNRVNITDIKPEILQVVLRFIYTDDCAVFQKSTSSKQIARELFSAADKYQLEQLKILCENELSRTLSVDNVAETLVYADMHNAQHLKQSCIRLIISKRSEVPQTAWKEIKKRRELYLAICEQAFGDTEGEPCAKKPKLRVVF